MAHTVALSWTASSDVVDGYNIYKGSAAGAESTLVNTGGVVVGTSFTDSSETVGNIFYVARSVAGGVESVNSNEVSVSIRPSAPSNLVAIAS